MPEADLGESDHAPDAPHATVGSVFDTLFGILGWIWNHIWGALFIGSAVCSLFHLGDFPWWFPIVAIGCGIYFLV